MLLTRIHVLAGHLGLDHHWLGHGGWLRRDTAVLGRVRHRRWRHSGARRQLQRLHREHGGAAGVGLDVRRRRRVRLQSCCRAGRRGRWGRREPDRTGMRLIAGHRDDLASSTCKWRR